MEDVPQLVAFDVAKNHLRATTNSALVDADIQDKLDAATAIIIEYLDAQADDTWDETTVPGPVHQAILLQLGHLFAFRGDDTSDRAADLELAPGVRGLLLRLRGVVVA